MNNKCLTGQGFDAPNDCNSAPALIYDEYELERAINAATLALGEGQTRAEKMQRWRELCRLIDQRTPHRVRFMERVRDLT